jgi:curved DNA-binding protein CbpA
MSLYELLGVEPTATKEEIKTAYRVHAREHHPDKGGDSEQFKLYTEAYEILIDDKARSYYDKTGEKKKDSMEDEAERTLVEVFSEIIGSMTKDELEYSNLVDIAEVKIGNIKQNITREIEKAEHSLVFLEECYRRVSNKDNSDISNPLHVALQSTIGHYKKDILNKKRGYDVGNMMLDILKNIEFNKKTNRAGFFAEYQSGSAHNLAEVKNIGGQHG